MKIDIADIPKHLGKELELFGWIDVRRDHGKLIFFDLRDRSGKVQLVIAPEPKEIPSLPEPLRPEWVIRVKGLVAKRPEAMKNPKEPTGEVEVKVSELEILAKSKTPPFDISGDGYEIDEEIRMKHRYLDLRRPRLLKNLLRRDKVIIFIRDYLHKKDFIEIETPLLTKSTPEGARDYIVPSRLQPGNFYALPESPQQYKQLLMVAGVEKYFQIARALRDEDTRGDRQPEHTQLDIEMSFVKPEDVMSLVETMVTTMVQEIFPQKKMKTPWPRISYKEPMETYGNDKPDLREDKNDPDEIAFAWVVNFPSFERDKQTKEIQPVHHMFVQPSEESVALLD